MYSAEHCGNYRNLLTHTLDHPTYVGLEVLSVIVALLIQALLGKTALIKTIIPLSKQLSIVFCAASKICYRVKESQSASLLSDAGKLSNCPPYYEDCKWDCGDTMT